MRKILIVFYGDHLPYSPSTLSIFYFLKREGYLVNILANSPNSNYSSQKIEDESILYISTSNLRLSFIKTLVIVLLKLLNKLFRRSRGDEWVLNTPIDSVYIKNIKKQNPDVIIAVDFFSLWCVQQLKRESHLLSLQIEDDVYYKRCKVNLIKSVIIQSKERYDYLFDGNLKPPIFIFPNSQAYLDFVPPYEERNQYSLVYSGSALIDFGIFSCLDFLVDYEDYSLTIKGSVPLATKLGIEKFYNELLVQKRLIIDETYLSAEELTRYLSRFRIGFAFYDFYRFTNLRNFNYYTAPSGKMYQYFNSGVPVIGNAHSGFSIVIEKGAGEIVGSLGSYSIKKAIDTIEHNYLAIARSAKEASKEFDLDKYLKKIPDTLINE